MFQVITKLSIGGGVKILSGQTTKDLPPPLVVFYFQCERSSGRSVQVSVYKTKKRQNYLSYWSREIQMILSSLYVCLFVLYKESCKKKFLSIMAVETLEKKGSKKIIFSLMARPITHLMVRPLLENNFFLRLP